jgi:phage terminase large subunit GpA-like protein
VTSRFANILRLAALAAAAVLTPPQPLVASEWMAQHLVVPDGPRAGGRWDPLLTPYVAEIVDCLNPDSPHNLAVVRKSAQTGVSVAAIGLVAAYIDRAPCRIGYALPTIDALQEFNAEKLTPTIEQTDALQSRIRKQTSRSTTGSTVTRKKFPGGSLVLMNANSATDLKSKTLKLGIGDEVDEWEHDLDGQGDPWGLFEKRFIAFHATGDWKMLALSTPTLLNASRIDAMYNRGDQRQWHITCPGCREEVSLYIKGLAYNRKPPFKAHYVAQCCGTVIEHHQKAELVRAGRFIPTNPDGLYPSFHVDALISQLTTWDEIAREAVMSEGDERATKKFYNHTLGWANEVRGDAPDYVRLMERREDYPENRVPPLGLLLVAGADVQHSGIWIEVVAFAPDRQSWTITRRFLAGDTTDPNGGAFADLAKVYDERFEDAYGNKRAVEAMAVDAGDGGRANQVYAFTRGRARAYAIKGMPGWGRPALGTPVKVQITLKGKKIPGGATLWPVGTWDLKANFYADVRKEGRKAGQEIDPPGYCHFGTFLDEAYFRQITAESLKDTKQRGRIVKVWQENGPNHLLDCRTYATAMAEHLGLTKNTRDQWLALARLYNVPGAAADLFATPALAVQRTSAEEGKPDQVTEDLKRSLENKPIAKRRPRMRVLSRGVT